MNNLKRNEERKGRGKEIGSCKISTSHGTAHINCLTFLSHLWVYFFPPLPSLFPFTMTSTIDTASIGKPPLSAARAKRRHVRSLTGDFPEVDEKGQEKWPRGDEATWKTAMRGITSETPHITKSIVNHVQTSLARAPYNIDDFGAYQSAALSVRDNLIVSDDLLGCFKDSFSLPSYSYTGQLPSIVHCAHFIFLSPFRT